jgi:polyferredoxin
LRDRNALYRENFDGEIENVYTLKIVNKSQQDHTYTVTLEGFDTFRLVGETTKQVEAGEVGSLPITVAIPPQLLTEQVTEFSFVVQSNDDSSVKLTHETRFIYE